MIIAEKTNMALCKACNENIEGAKNLGHKNGYDLLLCPTCSTVTISPFPTEERLMAYYQSYEGTTNYLVKRNSKIKRAKKRISKALQYSIGKKFLDVGCNYGFTVQAALEMSLDGHGIDIDNTAIKSGQEKFGKERFTCVSVQDYEKTGAKFDLIYSADVIEHVPCPDSFVKSIANMLDKGGVLFLGTPDSSHWRVPQDFISWNDVIPPEHVVLFSRQGIQILLEKHGFKIKKFLFGFKPGMRLIAIKE